MYKLKCSVLLFFTGLLLITAGCNPTAKNSGIDRRLFKIVEKYVYEIVPAVEDAKYDVDQWSLDKADSQTREWLECDAEVIAEINGRHLNDDFPDSATMEKWSAIPVARGDEEWSIEGRKLASLVERIISSTRGLTVHLETASREGENVTPKERREVGEAMEEAYQTAIKLRSMFGF